MIQLARLALNTLALTVFLVKDHSISSLQLNNACLLVTQTNIHLLLYRNVLTVILLVSLARVQAPNVPLALEAYSLILQYIHVHRVVLLANIEINLLTLVNHVAQPA